jgi:ABC-type multidrug transport system fused ATPase/permease subunit
MTIHFISYIKNFLFILGYQNLYKFISIILLNFILSIFELLSIFSIIPLLTILISDHYFNEVKSILNLDSFSKDKIIIYSLIFLFLVFLIKFIYTVFVKYINSKYIHFVRHIVSDKLFYSYISNKFNFFLRNNSSILLRNIEIVNSYSALISILLILFLDLTFVLLVIITGFYFDIKLTFSLSLFVVALFLIHKNIFRNKILNISNKKLFYEGINYKQITETFSAIKEVITYKLKDFFFLEFSIINKKKNKLGSKLIFLNSLPVVFFEFITVTFVICYIFLLVFSGKDYKEIVLLVSVFSIFAFKVIPAAARTLASYQSAISYSASIDVLKDELKKKIYNSEKLNFSKPNKLNIAKMIKIDNFSIKYNNKKLFSKSSLAFEKGVITSITGDSGSGKTSIVNYLTSLIASKNARLFIDNKIINRNNFVLNAALVGKDNFILDDTIKNNIIFKDKFNKIYFEKVCKLAHLNNFINSLPNKFNEVTGEKGLKLSDGQKQRIFIARALYKKPSILVFDEATNSLDEKNEKDIIKSIIKLKYDVIIIFISHNIDLVKKISDRIYFINSKKKNIIKIK